MVIEDTPGPFATRALPPTYDVLADVALGTTETSTRGAVWSIDLTALHNHALGAGSAVATGAAIPLGVTAARAIAVDDRTPGALRLAVCSTDAGLRLYDLSAITTTLPAPIRTVGDICRDVALDADGSFWMATSTGVVRVDADGVDRARPAAAEGAPSGGVARVAVAWGSGGREVWALSDTGDVYVVTASAP